MSAVDWSTELEMQLSDGGETYPFVEDEYCNVTGYGHQDRGEFAAALNRYDEECQGWPYIPDERWTADDICHEWAVVDPANDERLIPAEPTAPGAMPLTTLWGAR